MRLSSGFIRSLGAPLALGAALFLPRLARADELGDLEGLLSETVVSGASKKAELASDAPATTSVLSAADMRRYGIRTVAEALEFLGMGAVAQDPLHAVEVGSRGVLVTGDYGGHFLVVVDGHALNEAWSGTAYYEQGLAVPLELIDRIELILGPGSVLYGGNAMLGVINVITKTARSHAGLTLVAEGGLSPQQGPGGTFTSFAPKDLGTTYRLGLGFGKSFRLFGEDASLVAHAELYRQDGPSFEFPRQGGNVNPEGAPIDYGPRAPALGVWGGRVHDQYYASVPTVWAKMTLGNLTVQARASSYRRATPYINYFNLLASDFDEARTYETDRWLSLDVRYEKRVGDRVTLVGHGYGDYYRYAEHDYLTENSECVPLTGPCIYTAVPVARWAGAELQANIDWLRNDTLTTLIGADVRGRNVGLRLATTMVADPTVVDSIALKETTDMPWAVYAQQRYSPMRGLQLNAGARLDSDPRAGKHVSPRAAFAVNAWKDGVVKGIYSEAFRAPTYFETIYRTDDSGMDNRLRPEVVRGVEATVEQRLGAQRLLLGVYRTWWYDMISLAVLDPALGTLAYQNASKITNYGLNTRFEGSKGNFAYGASLTWAYARRIFEDRSVKLPVAPHLFGNARVSYDLPGAWPTLALASSFVGSRLADRANDGNFPVTPRAPFSVTFRGTVSGEVPRLTGLSYRLSVNYVTAAVSPYVVGPNQTEDPTILDRPPADLAPVNKLSSFATLIYELPL